MQQGDLGRPAACAADTLRAQGIVVSEKDNHLRAAVHFYNNDADLDRFLDAVQSL